MKKIAAAIALALGLVATASQAADKKGDAPQHGPVPACNAEAANRGLEGAERNRFVSSCVAEGKKRQNEVTKACTEAAAYRKTSERKDFMAECTRK